MKKLLTILLVLFSFTAMAQPCADEDTVRSNAVTLITATTVRVNGSISHFTSGYTTLYMQYVRVGQTDTATTSGVSPLRNLTGLVPNTQYYYYYKTICVSGTNRQLGPYYFTTAVNTIVYATERSTVFPYVKTDSGFKAPRADTSLYRAPGTSGGDIMFKTSDSTMYYYNGARWTPMAVDSAGMLALLNNKVDSVTVDSVTNILYYWKQGVSYGYALPLDSAYVDATAVNDSTLRLYRLNGDSTDVVLRGTGGGGGGSGTVTSVATNNGTGITGGTITTTGTLAIDTLHISTRAWRKKGVDSLGNLIAAKVDTSRTLTINGVTYSLGANRTWVVTPTAPGTVYVTDFGADSTGVYGSALAFQTAVATGKTVIVPPGLYKLDSTTILNTGQKIFGFGKRSVLKTSTIGGGSPFNIIQAADTSIIDNLAFKGSGYAAYNAGPTFTYQNGVYLPGNYATVSNCYFDSISGSGIQAYHPSLSLVRGNKVLNCIFTNSSVGILDYALSEYMTVDNIITHSNDYGILRWGGNFVLSNSHIDYNVSAGYKINGSSNGDHGTNANNSFNHNAGYALIVSNTAIGELFTSCNFFFGNMDITDADNLVFSNCAIWTPTVAITASTTTKTTTFTGGYQDATVTFTPTGTAKLIRVGLGKANTNHYIINSDTIVVNDLIHSTNAADKMVVWDSTGKKLGSRLIPSGGTNIYNSDGTLTGDRVVDGNGNDITFTGSTGTPFFNVEYNKIVLTSENSGITIQGDSIIIDAESHLIHVDSLLQSVAPTNKMVVWDSVGKKLYTQAIPTGGGGVTSIATTANTGLLGGTITSTGTLYIDTLLISTRAWRKKLADSLGALIGAGVSLSGTNTWTAQNTFSRNAVIGSTSTPDATVPLIIDAASTNTADLFQVGKNGNPAYFRLDNNGNITTIGGGAAPITNSGGKPYFSSGFAATSWASASEGNVILNTLGGSTLPWTINASASTTDNLTSFRVMGNNATTKGDIQQWTDNSSAVLSVVNKDGKVGVLNTAPNSSLQVGGSFSTAYVAKTATYTATALDYTIECTANTFTVTLPTAVGCAGRFYFITNSGAGTITLATTSSQVFRNVTATPTTLSLGTLTGVTVQSNGADWLKVSSF